MIIDCSQCEFQKSEHCKDCLVTALLEPNDEPIVLDAEEEEAIKALQEVGLAPTIKFRRRKAG